MNDMTSDLWLLCDPRTPRLRSGSTWSSTSAQELRAVRRTRTSLQGLATGQGLVR